MIRETLSAPMLFRREGVIMLDSIQSLLDSLPEGAVLIRQGTAVYINAMARQLLPQLSPGAPLPDFISLPSPEEAGTGLFVSGSTPYSFSCSSHQEDQLLLFRPAPQTVLDSRQLGGTLRQLRELLGEILAEVGPATGSTKKEVPSAEFSKSFHRLSRLAENLTYIWHASEGGPEFHPVTMDLAGLCHRLDLLAGPLLYEIGVTLDYRSTEESLLIPGDPDLLQKLLLGLLSNAAKAVGRGEVVLSLRRQGRRAFVRVSDSGPLPSQRQLAGLTRQDLGDELPLPGQGAGLGLDIARHIAALHGGSLLVSLGTQAPVITLSLPTGPLTGRVSVRTPPKLRRDNSLDPVLMELSDVIPLHIFALEGLD